MSPTDYFFAPAVLIILAISLHLIKAEYVRSINLKSVLGVLAAVSCGFLTICLIHLVVSLSKFHCEARTTLLLGLAVFTSLTIKEYINYLRATKNETVA